MVNLISLMITGDLASALALTRKPATPPGRSSSFYLFGVSASVVGMDSITMAAELTRWDKVTLLSDHASVDAWAEDARNHACEIAKKRGIGLSCDVSD